MSIAFKSIKVGDITNIFFKELKDVLRDRRAVFFTFIFPLLLYPLLFLMSSRLQNMNGDTQLLPIRMGLWGHYDEFFSHLRDEDLVEVSFNVPPKEDLLESEDFDVLIAFDRVHRHDSPMKVRVFFDGALSVSRDARQRTEELLERYRIALISRRLRTAGSPLSDAGPLAVSTTDIAPKGERTQLMLARFLPAILIMLFFTGGAFAAMDLVAGEKERGTFETLLVQPVSSIMVAAAKFLVVILCSFGAAVLNLIGMALARTCQPQTGLLAEIVLPPLSTMVLIGLTLLPLAVLTSGLLLAISSLARTFREAQTYLVPVMLLGLLPTLLATLPNVELDAITCWIPVANISLAIRDTIIGEVSWGPYILGVIATLAYACLVVYWAAGLLTREDIILGTSSDTVTADSKNRMRSRRALIFALSMLLFIYYTGTLAQSPDGLLGPFWGLAVTLWILVLVPAALFPRFCKVSLIEAWALRQPAWKDCLLAALMVPAAAVLMVAYMELQNVFLPFPVGLQESFQALLGGESLHPVVLFILFAVSPAVCEELLWRGSVQGELEREGRPLKAIILVGIFFGLFHLSIHRFMPTALLGMILAWLRWRTRSIFPPILFHCAYNATLVFVMPSFAESSTAQGYLFHPLLLISAAGIVALALWRVGNTRSSASPDRARVIGAGSA